MLPKPRFSKPIFGRFTGSTKLGRPYCKQFLQDLLRFESPQPEPPKQKSKWTLAMLPTIRKLLAPIKIKSALPPPKKKKQNTPPPKTRNLMDMAFSCRKNAFFQAPIKLAQPFPARIFSDTKGFPKPLVGLGPRSWSLSFPRPDVHWSWLSILWAIRTARCPPQRTLPY